MTTRRSHLKTLAALTTLGGAGRLAHAAEAAPSTVRTPLDFKVPPGACDSHVHVFADTARFPYSADRSYTPPMASAQDLLALQKKLSMQHVVIVTPSVYGTDNGATLDGIAQLGQARARGVAVVDPGISPAELDRLHQAGIRGVRVFLGLSPDVDLSGAVSRLNATARALAGRPWHLQIYARLSVLEALKQEISALQLPVVLDHFAGADGADGVRQKGFDTVLGWLASGKAYVKLSGAYYGSLLAPGFEDMAPLAKAFIAANANRLVWGSDWPHPGSAPVTGRAPTDPSSPRAVDDGAMLNLLVRWASDEATLRKILVDNPKRLYGF